MERAARPYSASLPASGYGEGVPDEGGGPILEWTRRWRKGPPTNDQAKKAGQ